MPTNIGLPQPTKCRVRFLAMGNVRLEELVTDFAVYASIHKPYLTGKMILTDHTNLIENIGYVGGEPVVFSWDAGDGAIFSGTLHLLKLSGEQPEPGLRAQRYTADLIGIEYFIDKQNMVQKSFKGMTGGAAINDIHGTYFPSSLSVERQGSVLGEESYIINSKNPLTAIDEIRRMTNWGSTGNAMYFRRYDNRSRLVTLEQLIAGAQGPRFIQKTTWGLDWFRDQFESRFAIIACVSKANGECQQASQRGSMGDISGAAMQGLNIFDLRQKREVMNQGTSQMGSGISGFNSGVIGGSGGGHGGQPNFGVHDSAARGLSQNGLVSGPSSRAYAAGIGNGATFIVKVPIQGGIDLQPGGGAFLQLVPPIGDGDSRHNASGTSTSAFSGMYMITDIAQSFSLDDRQFQAVSVFSCTRNVRSALD
jgi:hypothetical protein